MKKIIVLLTLALATYHSTTAQFPAAEYLDINRVKARYMVHGDMFWDPATGDAAYEFPKGSGKHSGFASSLWIGGINQSTNTLHLAGQKFRTNGNDYWPGPLDINNGAVSDTIQSAHWAQIWKVNKTTIDSFLQISNHTLANTPSSILKWPGKGANGSLGAQQVKSAANGLLLNLPNRDLAPFVDVNNDNVYNPLDGDYPKIKGEQMLWWIFNDNSASHGASKGLPMKIEIHASAYACNQTGIENTTFLNYKIYNYSSNTYDSTVISFWNDIDLGYAFDDYVGYDSSRRMGVTYNGDPLDETQSGYGTNLTQKAAVVLKHPSDIGNNRSPLGAFTISNNGSDGDPQTATEFYNYMTGSWRDGTAFKKGCDLLNGATVAYPFAFPDDPSDINGISEVRCNKVPFDRRIILSGQPFTMYPGSAPIEFTLAFINTDLGVDNSNFDELRRLADTAYKYPDGCQSLAWPTSTPNITQGEISIYPNPANSFFTIQDTDEKKKSIKLYNAHGQEVYKKVSSNRNLKVPTGNLAKGLYFLQIKKDDKQFSQTVLLN